MKLIGELLFVVLLVTFMIVLSPLFVPMMLYELTPHRRNQLFVFETKILGILARNGETRAADLLKQTNAELGANFGVGTFFTTMRRLETAGEVKRRREMEESKSRRAKRKKKKKKYPVSYFRITGGGRRSRVKRARTMTETVRDFGGILKPVPA